MSRFFILLIEDQISITANLVLTIGQHLADYTLSIAANITEAVQSELPQVILLDIAQLSKDINKQLSPLITTFPETPIILLCSQPTIDAKDEALTLAALSSGISDYAVLSEVGLLALGRRLAALYKSWKNQQKQPTLKLEQLITNDTSQLAIQLIGADNRVRAWNQAAETFFGITQKQAINHLIDNLPFSANNLGRIKDILDQARSIDQPFFIPLYPFDSSQPNTEWSHVHVYPITQNLPMPTQEPQKDICIVITQVPNFTQPAPENMQPNQNLQILLEASREISEQLELQLTQQKVVEQANTLLNGDNCQIYLLEKDNKTLHPTHTIGPLAETIQTISLILGQGTIGRLASTNKATIINKIGAKSEIPYPQNAHLLSAPLTAVGGTIGLIIVSRQEIPFDEDDRRFFASLIQQASSAINNARLFEETARSLNELAALYEASTAISTYWEDQDVLDILIKKMVQTIDVSRGFIAIWNKERNKGLLEAEYFNEYINHPLLTEIDPVINLSNRNTLLTMLNQQRPIMLDRNNASLDKSELVDMEKYGCLYKLLVPLVTKGETIGWMELWETQHKRTFTSDEVWMSQTLASQVAVALQNTQYMKQTQRTLEETTALYRVASALTTLQDSQAIVTTVLEEYLYALSLKQGSLVLFDFPLKCGVVKACIQDERPVRHSTLSSKNKTASTNESAYKAIEGRQIPLSNNPVYERLMQTRQPVIINNPKAEWVTASPPATSQSTLSLAGDWGDEEAFAILLIPVKILEEIVGVLVAENTRYNRPFNQWSISLGQAMADQLGVGLQNVQLYEAEYHRRQQAETLREVSSVVGSSLNLNEVLEHILDQLQRVIHYDSAAIHLIEGKKRRVIAGRGFHNLNNQVGLTYPATSDSNEPGSVAIHTRQPILVDNMTERFRAFTMPEDETIKSWIGIPLVARDKVIGLISIDHGEPNAYTQEDVHLAQAFANQVAIALENARLHDLEMRKFERELDFAQEIQETLLPQFIPQIPDLDIAGRIVPARQVGGDFFHFFSTDQEQLGVAVGDVSGKGIPAALYMAAGITAIDTLIDPDVMPGELLNKLNTKLHNRLSENKMNIALLVATFIPLPSPPHADETQEKASGSIMTVASAGMIAPIGATEHGCRFLPVGGFPVGALPPNQLEYTDEIFLLDPYTTIIFTSDGIVEAQNNDSEMFGFDRLEKTILEIVSTHDAAIIAEYIVDAAQDFIGDTEQHDDMTVVVVAKT